MDNYLNSIIELTSKKEELLKKLMDIKKTRKEDENKISEKKEQLKEFEQELQNIANQIEIVEDSQLALKPYRINKLKKYILLYILNILTIGCIGTWLGLALLLNLPIQLVHILPFLLMSISDVVFTIKTVRKAKKIYEKEAKRINDIVDTYSKDDLEDKQNAIYYNISILNAELNSLKKGLEDLAAQKKEKEKLFNEINNMLEELKKARTEAINNLIIGTEVEKELDENFNKDYDNNDTLKRVLEKKKEG